MRKRAFSLVELLTVIAIIALLSAIIFPVFARTRIQAQKAGDISAMNDLRSALQLYRVDNGGYPPALLGYVNRYSSGPNAGSVIPANNLTGYLYPKRVGAINTFKPGLLRVSATATTNAVWPNQDPRTIGSAPVYDVNGDGRIDAADDNAGVRQAYGPSQVVLARPGAAAGPSNPALEYYQISGYDVAQVRTGSSSNRYELRYTLFWSNYAIGQGSGYGAGSGIDDPRQLGYSDPPDNTVVTWNSFFRDYEAQGAQLVPQRNKNDVVLFLNGAARAYDSRMLYDQSWRVVP